MKISLWIEYAPYKYKNKYIIVSRVNENRSLNIINIQINLIVVNTHSEYRININRARGKYWSRNLYYFSIDIYRGSRAFRNRKSVIFTF